MNDPTYNSKNLNTHGKYLIEKLNELVNPLLTFKGWGSRFQLDGEWETIALFRQELAKAKQFTKTTWFYNIHLRQHANELLDIVKYVMQKIKAGNAKMEAPLPVKPLAQKVRENG